MCSGKNEWGIFPEGDSGQYGSRDVRKLRDVLEWEMRSEADVGSL